MRAPRFGSGIIASREKERESESEGDGGLPQVAPVQWTHYNFSQRTLDTLHDEWLSLGDL